MPFEYDTNMMDADSLYRHRQDILDDLLAGDEFSNAMLQEIDKELEHRGLPTVDPAIDVSF